jgi:hypothetical protein
MEMLDSLWLTLVLVVVAATIGAVMALVWMRWFLLRQVDSPPAEPTDPYVAAALDAAAIRYAREHGRPELAPIILDKLLMLHRIGTRRERGRS